MNIKFETFIGNLTVKLDGALPGNSSHIKLMPDSRKKYADEPDLTIAKPSSVLSLFFPQNNQIMLVFIQRPVYNGVHSGQIAFPGGRYENTDSSFLETALRETEEEIGVSREKIKIIGKLSPLYIPPSNFLVNPYVGYMNEIPQFNPDPVEVHEVFALNVFDLLKDECLQMREVIGKNYRFMAPCFYHDNRLIWGATSMMLSELLDVIRQL